MRVLIVLLCLLLFSCSEKETSKSSKIPYTIGVEIKGFQDNILFLEEMRDQRWIRIDSAIADNGRLELKGEVFEKDIYRLRSKDNQFILVYLDGEPLTLTTKANSMSEWVEVLNSPNNKILSDFNKKVVVFNKQHSALQQKLDSVKVINTKAPEATVWMQSIKNLEAEFDAYIHTTIRSSVHSPVVFSFLSYLDWTNDLNFIEDITNQIKKAQPNYKYTLLLVENLNRYKTFIEQKALADQNNPGAVGKEAPDFALPDPKGKMIRLSSYRGKYVLVDFWASWCGPCRQEMPTVVEAYKKYKGKNFDVLGVSLDNNKENWLKAIQSDGMIWKQVSDLKMWESTVVPLYKIEGIPATYLVDPKGIVIARDLRGPALEKKLDEVLPK